MLENCYNFDVSSDFKTFEFISNGPNGDIIKVVTYSKYEKGNLWNLGFGDKDPHTGILNDLLVSNNGDREKVLTTVAATLKIFIEMHPDAEIVAIGNTDVRNRLYRMGISNNLDSIELEFEIQGLNSNGWELFKKNVRYEAFYLKRKL